MKKTYIFGTKDSIKGIAFADTVKDAWEMLANKYEVDEGWVFLGCVSEKEPHMCSLDIDCKL